MANSPAQGLQMQREAKQRRFYEAKARASLGDGLKANWTIQTQRFPTFTPILDFTHALSYLHAAAQAVHSASPAKAWDQYTVWMTGCWRGEIDQLLAELQVWHQRLGPPPRDISDSDPRKVIAKTLKYLTNNRDRMDYATDRRNGLPITTAGMESLVKEMNYRVKGTEMFWNKPLGAEAILQIRAAALRDDDRLDRHLNTRPGHAFVRPAKPTRKTAATKL